MLDHIAIGDSRTFQPFRLKRAKKKDVDGYTRELLKKALNRLGFRTTGQKLNSMKEVKVTVPAVVIDGKTRKRGESVTISNMKAAELAAMKVVAIIKDVPDKQPFWETGAPEGKKGERTKAA